MVAYLQESNCMLEQLDSGLRRVLRNFLKLYRTDLASSTSYIRMRERLKVKSHWIALM